MSQDTASVDEWLRQFNALGEQRTDRLLSDVEVSLSLVDEPSVSSDTYFDYQRKKQRVRS